MYVLPFNVVIKGSLSVIIPVGSEHVVDHHQLDTWLVLLITLDCDDFPARVLDGGVAFS